MRNKKQLQLAAGSSHGIPTYAFPSAAALSRWPTEAATNLQGEMQHATIRHAYAMQLLDGTQSTGLVRIVHKTHTPAQHKSKRVMGVFATGRSIHMQASNIVVT